MLNEDQATFHGWWRPGIYDRATGLTQAGRQMGQIDLKLSDRTGSGSETRAVEFLIMGPPDVRGIQPGAILATVPAPDTHSVMTTRCPYVTFSAPDLPWRYTPLANPLEPGNLYELRPWIVLVVGVAGDEIEVNPDGAVRILQPDLLADYLLVDSAKWAHVQVASQRARARLLSARQLKADNEYLAAIVPAFDGAGQDRWNDEGQLKDGTDILPCYHHWRFWTGEAGDFKTLAQQLKVRSGRGVGLASVRYQIPGAESYLLQVPGALIGIGQGEAPLPCDEAQAAAEADLAGRVEFDERDEAGRPIVGLPRYGSPWFDDPSSLVWGEEINYDPRHRAIAGLGAWLAQEKQEALAQAAADQIGALDVAAQRIANLVLGLVASTSLWNRRLPRGAEQRLLLYGPSMLRILTPQGPLRNQITGQGRTMVSAFFSSAARRIFRPATARARWAEPQAIGPARLVKTANQPPPERQTVDPSLPHLAQDLEGTYARTLEAGQFFDAVRTQELLSRIASLPPWLAADTPREKVPFWCLLEMLTAPAMAVKLESEGCQPDLDAVEELISDWWPEDPEAPPEPAPLEAVVGVLDGVLQATALVPARVLLATGLADLSPPEICVGLDLTVWRDMRDMAPDWLLPGVSDLEEDSIVGVETNARFVDAFLVGLNQQLVGELRWRNIALASRCTPVKMFWDRAELSPEPDRAELSPEPDHSDLPPAETPPPERQHDIRGIHAWQSQTANALGGARHRPANVETGTNLVVVFRTELFRRYPQTIVSLVRATELRGQVWWELDPAHDAEQRLPILQGRLGEDVVFFGFDLPSSEADKYWLMLEEPPPGFGFRNEADQGSQHWDWFDASHTDGAASGMVDGAHFAAAALDTAALVLISGQALCE